MIERVLLSGTDLVLVIDGRRHTVGRVVGRDGRAPNGPEIEAAASKWLTQHKAELVGPAGADATDDMVAAVVANWLARHPPKDGEDGRPGRDGLDALPPDPEVLALLAKSAAETWLEAQRESLRGAPGKDGESPEPLPSIPGEAGAIGPMPRHEWDGTKLRFEVEPGRWGSWVDLRGKDGKEAKGKKGSHVTGGFNGITRAEAAALIEEMTMQRYDDYKEIEYLQDQLSDGVTPLVFTFSAPVQFVVIEMVSMLDQLTNADAIEALEGRATTGLTVPEPDLGALLKHEVPVSLLAITTQARTLTPADTRITVYGKRRPLA